MLYSLPQESTWRLMSPSAADRVGLESSFNKDGIARLVVEMVKREWPQQVSYKYYSFHIIIFLKQKLCELNLSSFLIRKNFLYCFIKIKKFISLQNYYLFFFYFLL